MIFHVAKKQVRNDRDSFCAQLEMERAPNTEIAPTIAPFAPGSQ